MLDRDKTLLECLQSFGPIVGFSVSCSPLEISIITDKIKKHFVPITVENYNPLNTVRSMFGMKKVKDKEVIDSFNFDVDYSEVIGSIVVNAGCYVYVFMILCTIIINLVMKYMHKIKLINVL